MFDGADFSEKEETVTDTEVSEPSPEAIESAPEENPAEEKEEPVKEGPDYVEMALSSGLAPLEMRFSQINSCYRKLPEAYRSFTYINSIIEGVIPPDKYAYALESSERSLDFAKWNIYHAMVAVRKMENAGRHISFVSARCPAKLALESDLYEWMKERMKELDFNSPEKICLEFPNTVLDEDVEKVRLSLLNMKLLKVKTMMSGCGDRDCPITGLVDLPFDYVLLSPWISVLSNSRNKGTSIISLISFFRSLQIEVIGDGIYNDDQISALNRADCFGYIPSSGYKGVVEHGRLRMTLDEAIEQKEEEV